jgi:hypothetical protein
MTILVYDFAHKKQTKAKDCWYASIQMLLSWREGQKSKPKGAAVTKNRDVWALGRTLDFGSDTGAQVIRDNGLTEIGLEIDPTAIASVLAALKKYGPFIVGGDYGPCGMGHFVVVCGVNTTTNMIQRDNPAWGYGKAWKPLSYLKTAWQNEDVDSLKSAAAVALRPLAKP